MGRETYKTTYYCGCVKEYSYEEVCGMGPIRGTEKTYMHYCDKHKERIDYEERKIRLAKEAIRRVHTEMRNYTKEQNEQDVLKKSRKREREEQEHLMQTDIKAYEQKCMEFANSIKKDVQDAKDAGKAWYDIENATWFDPQVSWGIFEACGAKKMRYWSNINAVRIHF